MEDYKHLAKKQPKRKTEKLVLFSLGALIPLCGYHIYGLVSIWLQSIYAYIQSEPLAPFAIILITITVLTIGGGITWDFARNHFRKKGRGMATMQQ